MGKVGELYVALGIRRDSSFTAATGWLNSLKGAALGVAGFFGIKGVGKALINFNAELESAKVLTAGVLAIARGTDLRDQYAEAAASVDKLNEMAVKLPGETMDYVAAMKTVAHPILQAKGSMQDVLDITIATRQFSKLANTDMATGARGVMRALNGNVQIRDLTIVKMLQAAGYTLQEYRDAVKVNKAKALTMLLEGARSKQARQLREEENKTLQGQKEELTERARRFMARAGLKLFERMKEGLVSINQWLEKNKEKVEQWADALGNAIADAVEFIVGAVKWLAGHLDEIKLALKVIVAIIGVNMVRSVILFVRAWGPILAVVVPMVKLFEKLQEHLGTLPALVITAFATGAILGFIGKLREAAIWMGILKGGAGGGIPLPGGGKGVKGKGGPNLLGVNPTTAIIAFAQALTPDTGVKNLPEGSTEGGFTGGERLTNKGLLFERTGEFSMAKLYEDLSSGKFFGETLGRGYSDAQVQADPRLAQMAREQAAARAEYVRQYNVTINVQSTKEAAAAMDELHKNRMESDVRSAADSLPEGQ